MAALPAGTGYWFFQLQGLEWLGAFDTINANASKRTVTLPPEDLAGVHDRDVLFLWAGGAQPGLKGWAFAQLAAAAPNAPRRLAAALTAAAPLTIDTVWVAPAPLPASILASARGLSDAPLVRQTQTGTFFRLSAEQAFEIAEILRQQGHPAPEVAASDVLDPIARRIDRELVGIRKLLPDLLPFDVARPIEMVSMQAGSRLVGGDLLAAYESLRSIADAIGAATASAQGERASLLAPLSAARTRLLNDLYQVARLSELKTPDVRKTSGEWITSDDTGGKTLHVGGDVLQSSAPPTDPSAARDPRPPASEPAPVRPPPPAPQRAPASEPAPASTPQPTPADTPAPQAAPDIEPATQAAAPIAPAPKISPPPPPPPPQPKTLPPKDPLFRYWEQTDLIGIGAAVNNLARYISHEGLVPPVAIGVFGDWGSGKSFFIKALQSQIALLSSQSRDALAEKRTTVFCSHIVQIEFNAWHFVESNLWASLAAHIFERLYAELERRGNDEGANTNIDGLYQQFCAYKQAVAEQDRLQELLNALNEKHDQAQAKKLAAEKSVKTRLLALTDVVKGSVKELATQRLTSSERKQLDDLLAASNLKELDDNADAAVAMTREGQSLFGTIKVQWKWWGGLQLTLFALIGFAVLFGLPYLIPWILQTRAESLTTVVTLVGGYVVSAAAILGWVARNGRKLVGAASKVVTLLNDARTRVEATPDPGLDNARHELETAKSELELIDEQLAEQRKRLAELADEVDPNQLGTRLQAFLEARVKSDAYQRHLGLISLVRKDFSSLYALMQKYWEQRKKPVPDVLAEIRSELGKVVEAQVPFIERIVLYIDDLDRCPEDKVVEVLQAVHLMLGLPLFVVVVAVDVRWVGESIRKHYGKLVDDPGSASADDYLEKIFQIPYRIHPMEPGVRKLLLGGLLRQPYLSAAGDVTQPPAIIQQELVPKEFSLYPEEQTVIEQLYEVVGSSPRRVRRFLDVYRLMRAGMEEGDVQELIVKRQYTVILALFAMLSGAPRTAPRMIELLRQESLTANGLAGKSLGTWHVDVLDKDACPADELDVIGYAMSYLDELKLPPPDLLAVLRRWIPEIARYSFREVRMQRL